MFLTLFLSLRQAKIPVTLTEYLTLLKGVEQGLAQFHVESFYHLARICLIKDERFLDRFDQVFGQVFRGLTPAEGNDQDPDLGTIPADWLRAMAEKLLTPEELAQIQALGGFEELMETLLKRLAEQQDRHQGGSKWIGTGGTSPFGAYGANPAGIRIGQHQSRLHRATKVWDRREFKNLDGSLDLGTRNFRMALRRLRRFARDGAATELDLDGTIQATAANAGSLDVKMRPERHNAVKILLLLDVGGSMDPHVTLCEELFSAARSEFKHLEHFYFHNCPYEGLWKENIRRHADRIPTWDVLHTFPSDWCLVLVGDAAMSPWEITTPGAAIEEWNEEPGDVWLNRLITAFPRAVWINPAPQRLWAWTESTQMIHRMMSGRMVPLTLDGLDQAVRTLSRGRS